MKQSRFATWDELNALFGLDPSPAPEGFGEYDPSEITGDSIPWNKGEKGLQDAWNKGISHTEETKEKIRKKATGRLISDATRVKMSLSRQGQKRPQSSAAISAALKGREITWADKISKSRKGKPTGRKMSYEQKKAMYEARWPGKSYEQMLKENS